MGEGEMLGEVEGLALALGAVVQSEKASTTSPLKSF